VVVPGFSSISTLLCSYPLFHWDCFHICIDTLRTRAFTFHVYILTTPGYVIFISYLPIVSYTGTRSSIAQGYIYRFRISCSHLLHVFYLHYLDGLSESNQHLYGSKICVVASFGLGPLEVGLEL